MIWFFEIKAAVKSCKETTTIWINLLRERGKVLSKDLKRPKKYALCAWEKILAKHIKIKETKIKEFSAEEFFFSESETFTAIMQTTK